METESVRRAAALVCLIAVLAFLGLSAKGSALGAKSLPVQGMAEQRGEPPAKAATPALSLAPALPEQDGTTVKDSGPQPVESYVEFLLQQTLAEIQRPGMSEYERAKAAYDYLLDSVTSDDPVCPELWRIYQKDPNTPVPFVENRAVGTLRFDIGMCEDQAAALTLLLQEMGLEAEYIPGFIFTIQGDAMDHAWMMAKVDGNWYHLDPDLESYRARRGRIIYQYFLKGDNDFYRTHRWGQNAIDAGYLGEEQNEELRQYLGHPCPEDYDPAAEPQRLNGWAEPEASKAMLLAEKAQKRAEEEIAAYEAEHGALAPIQLNMEPPVFGWEGYGPEIW